MNYFNQLQVMSNSNKQNNEVFETMPFFKYVGVKESLVQSSYATVQDQKVTCLLLSYIQKERNLDLTKNKVKRSGFYDKMHQKKFPIK